MNEIARHIHHLLQENDCVIVPDFGGFIAHYNAAKIVETDAQMLPPSREIAFNPLLKLNDGLLSQSYMKTYHTSFSEANLRISRAVKQLTRCLHENGSVFLPEIGELRFNIHQTYEFFPEDDKVISPSLYGLETFEMPTLQALKAQQEALHQKQVEKEAEEHRKALEALRAQEEALREAQLAEQRQMEEAKKAERQRIKATKAAERRMTTRRMVRRTMRYAGSFIALIALLMLLLTYSTPLQNVNLSAENQAGLTPNELLGQLKSQSLVTQVVVGHNSSVVVEKAAEEVPVMEKEEATKEAEAQPIIEAPAKIYHVIVASVGAPQDAERMAQQLRDKGYDDAKALISKQYNRIAIGSFATEQEAYSMVKQLKVNGVYEQSWVLTQK